MLDMLCIHILHKHWPPQTHKTCTPHTTHRVVHTDRTNQVIKVRQLHIRLSCRPSRRSSKS